MNKPVMRNETSLYIDGLRLAAVILVFIDHAKRAQFTGGFLYAFGMFGQEAVAVFFVISGIVIAYVVDSREHTLAGYLIARLSRLWSVVIPAVLLTIVLDSIGVCIDPTLYQSSSLPQPWVIGGAAAWQAVSPILFLNAIPHLKIEVGTNGPFWSLGYEAWYYFGFGFALFLRGMVRVVVLGLLLLAVGLPVLTLAPIWLLGVAVYHRLGRPMWRPIALTGFGSSALLLALTGLYKFKLQSVLAASLPAFLLAVLPADILVEKYLVALLVAANIVCFDGFSRSLKSVADLIETPLKAAVSCSFSLYLYQAPLLFFVAASVSNLSSRWTKIAIIYMGAIAGCVLLAQVTEKKKHIVARVLRSIGGANRIVEL
jgi:peptidoglycan/LPS O-acetylase OafA/YrhL